MKILLAATLSTAIAFPALAQTAHTAAAHKPATAATSVALKTQQDSLSYAIGLSLANFYKQQNITNVNTALVVRAINDVNKGGKLPMDEQQANNCIINYMNKAKADKASAAKKQGQEFLAANKSKPG